MANVLIDQYARGEVRKYYLRSKMVLELQEKAKKLVKEGKWATFCSGKKGDKSVIDLSRNDGLVKDTIGLDIYEAFKGEDFDVVYRVGILGYLLLTGLCYIEKDNKRLMAKMLGTKSVVYAQDWAEIKGTADTDRLETVEEEIYMLRMETDKDGTHKIVKPRKGFTINDATTRIAPIWLVEAQLSSLREEMEKRIVQITFTKDNGRDRVLVTTLNKDIISGIYGEEKATEILRRSWDGVFDNIEHLDRGYITVPELGASKYDSCTSAMNYARVKEITYDVIPDLTIIDYDVSSAVEKFQISLSRVVKRGLFEELVEALVDEEIGLNINEGLEDPVSISKWAEDSSNMIGRVFSRDLCRFMVSNPIIFDRYEPEKENATVNVGEHKAKGSFGSEGFEI